jgi:protein-disulfide isomerase
MPIKKEVQAEKKNTVTYVLVGLLVVAAFALGHLFTKVQSLEQKTTTTGQGTGNQQANAQQQVQPTVPAQVDITVTDADPVKGSKDAKVLVAVFADFQCPFCGASAGFDQAMIKNMQGRDPSWQPSEPNIIKDYVNSGKVRIVWKDYPFLGEESVWAAAAARCAQDQGKFWEYHEKLFSSQNGENQGAFSKDNLKKFAAEMGLNAKSFNDCVDTAKYETKVKEAVTYGQSVGVSGTPATFVDGKLVSGAASYSTFKTMIDAALK